MNHPEVVDRLAILNAAHPRRLSEGLHHPSQLRKSWYFFFFATPGLPEDVVPARDWHFFRHFLHDANPPYTREEIDRYIEAWSQPGAAAGMINYYRASVRQSQKEAAAKLRPISAPTLVIWGNAIPTSAPTSPSPTTTICPTSTGSSASPMRRIGSITTRPNKSTNCLPTSSRPPGRPSDLVRSAGESRRSRALRRPRSGRLLSGRSDRAPHVDRCDRLVYSDGAVRDFARGKAIVSDGADGRRLRAVTSTVASPQMTERCLRRCGSRTPGARCRV